MSVFNVDPVYPDAMLFTLFSTIGLWQPMSWHSRWKIWLYHIYSAFIKMIHFSFVLTLLLYLFYICEDTNTFIEYLYYFLYCAAIFMKQISITFKRKAIIDSNNKLLEQICQPRDFYELEIYNKCSEMCRWTVIMFLLLFNFTAATVLITPLAIQNKIQLFLRGWYPYKMETNQLFWFTFFFQVLGVEISTFTVALVEAFALTLIFQICTQLEICIHRLQFLSKLCKDSDFQFNMCQQESKILGDCMNHHMHVYSLGRKLNDIFGLIIFVQFFTSTISFCVIIYQLTRLNSQNSTYWVMLSFLFSSLTQIFLYCFYGEKVIEKSIEVADAIYDMNWINLSNNTKKDLVVMMLRAGKPIQLSGSIVVMTINTYVNILKSAYSVYNLLGNF